MVKVSASRLHAITGVVALVVACVATTMGATLLMTGARLLVVSASVGFLYGVLCARIAESFRPLIEHLLKLIFSPEDSEGTGKGRKRTG